MTKSKRGHPYCASPWDKAKTWEEVGARQPPSVVEAELNDDVGEVSPIGLLNELVKVKSSDML